MYFLAFNFLRLNDVNKGPDEDQKVTDRENPSKPELAHVELTLVDTVDGGLDACYLDSELPSVAQLVLSQKNSAVVFYLQGWGVAQGVFH